MPSGLEYRFIVCVEAGWRAEVYGFLASNTKARIPPDGGPLNLSAREALRVCELVPEPSSEESAEPAARTHYRQPRRIPVDRGPRWDTFRPDRPDKRRPWEIEPSSPVPEVGSIIWHPGLIR